MYAAGCCHLLLPCALTHNCLAVEMYLQASPRLVCATWQYVRSSARQHTQFETAGAEQAAPRYASNLPVNAAAASSAGACPLLELLCQLSLHNRADGKHVAGLASHSRASPNADALPLSAGWPLKGLPPCTCFSSYAWPGDCTSPLVCLSKFSSTCKSTTAGWPPFSTRSDKST